MIRLYMDGNVQGAITDGLRLRGIDVLTVQEDHRSGLPDPDVLDRAQELDRVLFSQDRDLAIESARRQRSGQYFYGVVYARQTVSIRQCIEDLEYMALTGVRDDFENRLYYLPL